MFEGILQRAQTTIDEVLAKYLGRVLVAVPLVVAFGLATAALTVKLSELYGAVWGLAIMAGAFVLLALLILVAVVPWSSSSVPNKNEESIEPSSAEGASPQTEGQLEGLLSPEIRSLLGTATPALPVAGRLVMKNLPVLIFVAMVVYAFTRFVGAGGPGSEEGPAEETGLMAEEGNPVAASPEEASEAA